METLKFLMTTTFYPPYHIGGDAVHVKYLAEELAKRGHEVHILHSLDAYAIKRHKSKKKEQQYENIYIHMLKSPVGKLTPISTYLLGNSSYTYRRYKEILKKISPDIVHHHNVSLLGFSLLKKMNDYLNIYTAHDYWLICPRNDLLKNGEEPCINKTCFRCNIFSRRIHQLWRRSSKFRETIKEIDSIIAPSKHMEKKLEKEVDVKITYIPNFVPKPPNIFKKSNYDNYFLYVGVLEIHKGIKILLEAFKDKNVDVKLVIIGGGRLESYIENFIVKNGLGDIILYLKWVDDETLWSMYADALALVIPSIWEENAPLVTLEALSVGTPVVGSDMGGLPEIIGKVSDRLIIRSPAIDIKYLTDILKNGQISRDNIKNIWKKYFSPSAYMNEYKNLISSLNGERICLK